MLGVCQFELRKYLFSAEAKSMYPWTVMLFRLIDSALSDVLICKSLERRRAPGSPM